MISAQRQEILRLLERLSELTPDVRFGQLIANLSYLALGSTKVFGIFPIGLGGDVAGTGLPEQRDGLVVEGFDA